MCINIHILKIMTIFKTFNILLTHKRDCNSVALFWIGLCCGKLCDSINLCSLPHAAVAYNPKSQWLPLKTVFLAGILYQAMVDYSWFMSSSLWDPGLRSSPPLGMQFCGKRKMSKSHDYTWLGRRRMCHFLTGEQLIIEKNMLSNTHHFLVTNLHFLSLCTQKTFILPWIKNIKVLA